MLFLRTSAHSATARTWRILACLAGPLVAAGCGGDDAKTTPVEWTFEIDSEVESATTRIELEVTRGACGSEGETAFSLAAAYPLSAAAAKPRSFEDGAYCFHARAYVDTCGPIGVAAEDFTVPIEEEPLAVHIASDVDALQACGVSPCGDVDCPSFLPSNITKANIDLLKASNARVVLDTTTGDEASRIWVLNSDDGSIRFAANVFDNLTSASSVQTWRAAGAGDDDATGVTFKSLSPAVPGGASIGAFAFGSIHIAQGVRVMAEGSNALLLIAQRDISIDGTLDVGQWGHPGGTLAPPGGGPAVPSGVGSPGGESGVALGGGGGGSFGMDGAPGGKLNGGVPGGSAGALHGNESLVPLVAGSAGGNGATTDNEDSIALHGTGGGGGGAVELVAGAKLAVSSTGGVFSPGYGGTGGRGKDAEPSPSFGSGGGGGSGGAVLLEAPLVVVLGTVAVGGGGGGQGADETTNAPLLPFLTGASGAAAYRGLAGTPIAAAGAGGCRSMTSGVTTAGYGGCGGDGSNATGVALPGVDARNGGGGGGGAGRIRINSASPSTRTVAATLLPEGASSLGALDQCTGELCEP